MGIISEIKIRRILKKPIAELKDAIKLHNASARALSIENGERLLSLGFSQEFLKCFSGFMENLDQCYNAVLENKNPQLNLWYPETLINYSDLKELQYNEEMPLFALHRNFAGLVNQSPIGEAFKEYQSNKSIQRPVTTELYFFNEKQYWKEAITPDSKALLCLAKNLLDDELYLWTDLIERAMLKNSRNEFETLVEEAKKSSCFKFGCPVLSECINERDRDIQNREMTRRLATDLISYGLEGVIKQHKDLEALGVYLGCNFSLNNATDRSKVIYLLGCYSKIIANKTTSFERYAQKFISAKEKLDRYGLDCFDSHFYNKNLGDRVVRLFSDDLVKGTEAYKWHRYC